jgi:L-alanine-DL-glutamate epimerase-like enolase superfamily enzyme
MTRKSTATSRRAFLCGAGLGATVFGPACSRQARQAPAGGVRNNPLDGIPRENIKITDVRVRRFACDIPLDKWWYGAGVTILTEVMTDQGLKGIGGPSPYGNPDFVKEYTETHIKPRVVGQNPFDLEIFAPSHLDTRRAMAWAGINVACWDIIGKAKNKPVHELLATNTNPEMRIEHYASAGTLYDFDKRPQDLYDEALRYKQEGFKKFKFRLAENFEKNMTIAKYIPFLRGLREAVGPDFDLIQELNMRLNLQQCLELAPVLKELKFIWLEEPVNRWGRVRGQPGPQREDIPKAIDEYLQVRKAVAPVPVSGGETMTTRFEFQDWIDRDAYDIVQPDCDTCGLSEGWYIAQHAHLHGKRCVPHNWHGDLTWMANIQLVAAIPNRWVLESDRHYNPFRGGLLKEPIVVKNGYAEVPKGPGLGVEIIDDADKKFPYDPNKHWLKLRSS